MIIFSVFYILLNVLFTIILFVIALILFILVRPFSKKLSIKITHNIAKLWGTFLMKSAFISFDIEGIENYDYKKTYLITPNHQSAFDIFCCFAIFKGMFAFVSKDTYGKVPMVGFGMSLANYIFVKRGTIGAAKSIDDMEDRLKSKTSIIIYPEGTRSKDGEIKKPKRGILKIAERCEDVAVLPVVIYGTRDIMKAGSFVLRPFKKIKIRFLEPFYFKDIEGDDNDKLDYWYNIMTKNYDELRNKL